MEEGLFSRLKFESQADAVTARRTNAGAGEEAGKVDQVEPVVKVLHVGLQAHEQVSLDDCAALQNK